MAVTPARLGILRLNAGRLNALYAPPTSPHTPSPAHGSARGPFTLTWLAESVKNYDVYFGTATTPPLVSSAQTAASYTLPALAAGQVYYWRIVARNDYGTTSGPTWNFTATVPPATTAPSPPHGATDQPNSLTLSWAISSSLDVVTYTLTYAVDGGPPVVVSGLGTTSYPVGPLPNNATISWRVQAVNNAGAAVSPTWTFATWVLTAPVLLSPPDNAIDVSGTTSVTWAASPRATSYDVYFGPTPSPPLVSSAQTALSYDPPGLLAIATYHWRIEARNAGGTTSSTQWSFSTADPTKPHISIDGVTPHMRIAGLTIQDLLNDRPNTCEFTVDETPPHVGQVVQIGLGGLLATDLIFAGTIDQVDSLYESKPSNQAWRVRCTDWWRRLNRYKITAHYEPQSASAIASHLVTNYSLGFSTGGIAPALPTVTGGIDFTLEDLGACLKRVMTQVGGYWYVDYSKSVHAFLTETTTPPEPLVPTSRSLMVDAPVTLVRDLSQIRTRVIVIGGGSSVRTDVAAGDTAIPIEDPTWFRSTGSGEVMSGTTRMPHGAVIIGGGGTTVLGAAAPTGASGTPAATIATGVGGVIGTTWYAVSFKNAVGETLVGPNSNGLVGVAFAAPTGAPTPSASGSGRLAGTYWYAITFATDRGETTLGPSAQFDAVPVATPSALTVGLATGIGVLVGVYWYSVTFVTALGETLPSPQAGRTAVALSAPGALTTANGGVGPLIGAYSYRLTFVTAYGETTGGTTTARNAAAGSWTGSVSLATSGVGPLVGTFEYYIGYVTAFGETAGSSSPSITPTLVTASAPTVSASGGGFPIDYAVCYVHPEYGESALSPRTTVTTTTYNITCNGLPAGCGWSLYSSGSNASGGPLYKVAEIGIGITSFTHAGQTGPAGGPRAVLGRGVMLSSIQAGPTGTVARRIYRTKAGASSWYLLGEIATGVTSYLDIAPDTSLTTPAPSFNTNGETVSLSSVPLGPSGTVARRIYRTRAGGASYFQVGELADNTTTTMLDNVPDDALTKALPTVSTAGGQRHSLLLPLGGADVLARRIYRSKSGESTVQILVEIQDNATTGYIDNTPDDGLGGAAPPLVATAGGQKASIVIPTGPTGTTGRNLYRTKVGGGEFLFVAKMNGNAGASVTDDKRDSELGRIAPDANTAGGSIISVTNIPIGPASITARRLYRADSAAIYRFVVELKDNTTTSYLDDKTEKELGDVAPTVSTIGALPGATELYVSSTAPFQATGGWFTSGSQIARYTGISGNLLTGIPTTGPGALVAPLKAGDEVVASPMLVGATIPVALARGDQVNVLEQVEDTAAQAALAALEGGDSNGIYVHALTDSRLDWRAANATGLADLTLFKSPIETLTYVSRDPRTATGKTIHADLPELGILGDYTIQTVTIDQIGTAKGVFPRFSVEASSARYSFEDVLRQLLIRP